MNRETRLLQDWVEELRIPDDISASAYDAFPASYRAALKTGIALNHFYYGDMPEEKQKRIRCKHLGFGRRETSLALDWTAIILQGGFRGPAALCSAVLLPVFSRVEKIVVFCLDAMPSREILLALDLCGMSDIFLADESQCAMALQHIYTLSARGNALLLCNGGFKEFESRIGNLGIPALRMEYNPRLLLADKNGFDEDRLRFCTGFSLETDPGKWRVWDAAFCSSWREAESIEARLRLLPGCEGYWKFDRVDLCAFRYSTLAVGCI